MHFVFVNLHASLIWHLVFLLGRDETFSGKRRLIAPLVFKAPHPLTCFSFFPFPRGPASPGPRDEKTCAETQRQSSALRAALGSSASYARFRLENGRPGPRPAEAG